MSILNDETITALSIEHGMITPFIPAQVREVNGNRVISYGLGSYGYDIRPLDFVIYSGANVAEVNPKAFDATAMIDATVYTDEYGEYILIPPNSYALANSFEYIKMPRDVTGIVLCKSTYIRAGLLIPTTVLEAGWEGNITLEVCNVTPVPARVYVGEGLVQVLFFSGDSPLVAYDEREHGGKYQGQRGITMPKV